MNIGEVCSREVYIVRKTEPLLEAAREMRKRHVGAVVVVEPQGTLVRPIGIVTDRDIVCGLVAREAELRALSVADVMTSDPLSVSETSDIPEAIERMNARGVRRAPVVSDSGDLVGIVSLDDLLPVVAEELLALAKLTGGQAKRERASDKPTLQRGQRI